MTKPVGREITAPGSMQAEADPGDREEIPVFSSIPHYAKSAINGFETCGALIGTCSR